MTLTGRKATDVDDWDKASTLGQTVFQLVQDKKTNEAEFKALLDYFGREKLLREYEMEKSRRQSDD